MKAFMLVCASLLLLQATYSQDAREDGPFLARNPAKIFAAAPKIDLSTEGSFFTDNAIPAAPQLLVVYSRPSPKSPLLAAVLSGVVPGMGQLYNDEYFPKGLIQTALCGAGVALALTKGWEDTYSASPYTDYGYYGSYTYYNYNYGEEVTTWLYVGFGVAGAAWLWSVIDAPVSASNINSRYRGGYGHMLEVPGAGYVVGVDPTATRQGVGASVVVHF